MRYTVEFTGLKNGKHIGKLIKECDAQHNTYVIKVHDKTLISWTNGVYAFFMKVNNDIEDGVYAIYPGTLEYDNKSIKMEIVRLDSANKKRIRMLEYLYLLRGKPINELSATYSNVPDKCDNFSIIAAKIVNMGAIVNLAALNLMCKVVPDGEIYVNSDNLIIIDSKQAHVVLACMNIKWNNRREG